MCALNAILMNVFLITAVLDTAAGVWCDKKVVVTSPRTGRFSQDVAGGDAVLELTRRCRHAAASVGDLIYMYGGLRGGTVFILPLFLCFFSHVLHTLGTPNEILELVGRV